MFEYILLFNPTICKECDYSSVVLSKETFFIPRPDYREFQGPLLLTWINFNPTWIYNYIQYNVWDETTYSSPNFNGATVEGWDG